MDPNEFRTQVLERRRTLRLCRVRGASGAYLIAALQAEQPGPLLWIAPDPQRAERALADLRAFLGAGAGAGSLGLYPAYDVAPYDRFSAHPEIESRRMSMLYSLLAAQDHAPVLTVTSWAAVLRRVPTRAELRSRVHHLERGMRVDRDSLLRSLVDAGYHRTRIVEERGEAAARGGILDLFPPQLERPVRLEIDFDEIESIRSFDPATQRSEQEHRSLVAIPPRPYRLPSNPEELLRQIRALGRAQGLGESNIYELTEMLGRKRLPPGAENLEALFHDAQETLFDYLPPSTLIAIEDPEAGNAAALAYVKSIFQGHLQARQEDRLVCEPLELYVTDEQARELIEARRPVLLDPLGAETGGEDALAVGAEDHRDLRREIVEHQGSGRALAPLATRLARWSEQGRRVRIACPTLSAAERLADILRDYGCPVPLAARPGAGAGAGDSEPAAHEQPASEARSEPQASAAGGPRPPVARDPKDGDARAPGHARIEVCTISQGFELGRFRIVVLTEQDIFGARVQRRPARATQPGTAIARLAQLQEGDHLVHAEHGIGRYGGLTQLAIGGFRQEFLLILYAEADKLYVPVSRLGQVQRFAAADQQEEPRLDKLGGQVWTRTRRRVHKAIVEMARELIAVVAAREVLEGYAYPPPDADYEEFEARFAYEDTPDQRRATEDVLRDLRRVRPMDRVVCGDVGFGKTEIACRAAYLVTSSGRQVAVLVPTTVLCQQHVQTLRQRFAATPVEIGSLSRLTSPAERRATMEGLASGRVDILVGTHRLLSEDVVFRNLGLIVVDEEHRFGVVHKERLKQLRKLVDVLTLTATPIPRTLQMAFTGMRDLSVINTPPPDRMAIRSQVARFDDTVIAEAIRRELRRGGQVFLVHNRIETMQEFAGYLRGLVPEARIETAHGQMPAAQLEKIMLRFTANEFDVLLCTAIIESGLDIPNANTILIHRADSFGLAQLYQLRGRVGRSDRQAYAYFLLPPEGSMTADGRRRIEAIQDLSELGAGFRLATEDLEIRGAGNLLGPEQSGHIASVGYDLYMEMLEQAIGELRGESAEPDLDPEIRLPITALLPDSYVEEVSQRLVFYKQLSSARSEAELREILDDLLDRYGPLPSEARNLGDVIRLKIRSRELGIESIETAGSNLVLRVSARARLDPERLLALIRQPEMPLRVAPDHKLQLRLRRPEDALIEAFGLLDLLEAAPRPEHERGGPGAPGGSGPAPAKTGDGARRRREERASGEPLG